FGTRVNLCRVVQELRQSSLPVPVVVHPEIAPSQQVASSPDQPCLAVEEDEEGFLELIEEGTRQFGFMTEAISRMDGITRELGDRFSQRPGELGVSESADLPHLRRYFNAVAADLEHYVERMEPEVPLFREACSRGVAATSKAIVILRDFPEDNRGDVDGVIRSVSGFVSSLDELHEAISSSRVMVSSFPRVTGPFGRARRRTASVLDSLLTELATARTLVSEVQKSLNALVDRKNKEI
ncbi:MAG: hypothetical protein NT025_02175, partial [bacterium]|nr:hypothetical protein [bacterium]